MCLCVCAHENRGQPRVVLFLYLILLTGLQSWYASSLNEACLLRMPGKLLSLDPQYMCQHFMCIVDSGSWTQILELVVLSPLLQSSQFKLTSSRNKTIILLESEKNLWQIPKHLRDKGLRDIMDTRYMPKNNKGNI